MPDACSTEWGNSTEGNRLGCPDNDGRLGQRRRRLPNARSGWTKTVMATAITPRTATRMPVQVRRVRPRSVSSVVSTMTATVMPPRTTSPTTRLVGLTAITTALTTLRRMPAHHGQFDHRPHVALTVTATEPQTPSPPVGNASGWNTCGRWTPSRTTILKMLTATAMATATTPLGSKPMFVPRKQEGLTLTDLVASMKTVTDLRCKR